MSFRVDRVGEQVRRELTKIVAQELRDPRLHTIAAIATVRMSADLQLANVAVSVAGDDQQRGEATRGLESASGFLRQALGRRLRLRRVPRLRFSIDTSEEDSQRLLQMIRGAHGRGEAASD